MSHAYTPGLRVSHKTVVEKKRILPIDGDVLVKKGDRVTPFSVIAKTSLPGSIYPVNIVNTLGIIPQEIGEYITKKVGDEIRKNEVIAENRPLISWFKTKVRSPIEGKIESISNITGQILLRKSPQPLDLKAYIKGEVVKIFPSQGALIKTFCSFIQGIFGVGGETSGELIMLTDSPDAVSSPDILSPEHKGKVAVAGSLIKRDFIKRAKEVGVAGIVVGGVSDNDLRELLGYDIGVAVTGTEDIGFTLILTEGFGRISMAQRTFELLASHSGKFVSISGATQIRAGVIRPEIIIPIEGTADSQDHADNKSGNTDGGLKNGDSVRIIREPHFGTIGTIHSLPSELMVLPTESKVRVLKVRFTDGSINIVPRSNVEIIED